MSVITALSVAWGSSVGALGGTLAFKGPARHDLSWLAGAWGRSAVGRVAWVGEAFASARGSLEPPFAHRTIQGRASVALGLGAGDERAHAGFGVGPALVVRGGRVGEDGFLIASPGLRGVAHLELALAGPLAARFQMGTVARGPRAWDWDAALGVGVWLP